LNIKRTLEDNLTRIRRQEPIVRAFAHLAAESARFQAEMSEKQDFGALSGVTVGVKDIIHVAGMPTAAGSRFLGDMIERRDATCVQRLRNAGALILGKTATTEFAFYDPAATRNPRNPEHTPGGSSSGSAAAVAAGFCSVAIGTQTFGSVIRPASYCGVFGLKPTYDAISREGVIPLAWSLDHVGIFTQSAALAADCVEVLFEPDFRGERPGVVTGESRVTRFERLRGTVAGVPDRYFFESLDTTSRTGFEAGIEALKRVGISLRNVTLPPLFEAAIAASGVILRAEAATFHRKWFLQHAADYSPRLREIVEAGRAIPAVDYLEARQSIQAARLQMSELMEGFDFLVTPSTPTVAPAGLSWTGDPIFNTPFSIAGFPAITLPAAYSPEGLPSGFQTAGRPWSETQLLRLALSLEEDGFGRFTPPRIEEKTT
jgi:aspartyl-tRNA(Asn)/glutamyl-tRNA(Gln) amidotransferase subunit A